MPQPRKIEAGQLVRMYDTLAEKHIVGQVMERLSEGGWLVETYEYGVTAMVESDLEPISIAA